MKFLQSCYIHRMLNRIRFNSSKNSKNCCSMSSPLKCIWCLKSGFSELKSRNFQIRYFLHKVLKNKLIIMIFLIEQKVWKFLQLKVNRRNLQPWVYSSELWFIVHLQTSLKYFRSNSQIREPHLKLVSDKLSLNHFVSNIEVAELISSGKAYHSGF